MKTDKLVKDFVFDKYAPFNPFVRLKNGKVKQYSLLTLGDCVIIKEDGKFVFGTISKSSFVTEAKTWTYKVKTNKYDKIRYIKDFKNANSIEK